MDHSAFLGSLFRKKMATGSVKEAEPDYDSDEDEDLELIESDLEGSEIYEEKPSRSKFLERLFAKRSLRS